MGIMKMGGFCGSLDAYADVAARAGNFNAANSLGFRNGPTLPDQAPVAESLSKIRGPVSPPWKHRTSQAALSPVGLLIQPCTFGSMTNSKARWAPGAFL